MLHQPRLPGRPPRPFTNRRFGLPSIGVEAPLPLFARRHLVAPVRMPWFVDDADVVAAAGEHEGQLGGVALQMQLVDRAPGSLRPRENGHTEIDGRRVPRSAGDRRAVRCGLERDC